MTTTSFLRVLVLSLLVGGCASSTVNPRMTTYSDRLPKPERVLVYDSAVSERVVSENKSIVRRLTSEGGTAQQAREADLGESVARAFAETLVDALRKQGVPAERAPRGTPVRYGDLQVNGHVLRVDEGNRLRRTVVGFGAGRSYVDTHVVVDSALQEPKRLMDFTTHADSGSMPGSAVTMGAGAAAQGGVTAGVAAANVAVGGIKAHRSEVERMAAKSALQAADQIVRYMSVQGWLADR